MMLYHGDCLDILPTLAAESVDACITDPPYGLKFMGKEWDHGVPGVPYWQAVSRVLKPGANLLAFGGTRTHHRLMVAIEDAGFEIRDCLMWLHGQGFPKGKSQLKPAWEPIILARKPGKGAGLDIDGCRIDGIPESPGTTSATPIVTPAHGAMVRTPYVIPAGRWPANVVLSHEPECQEIGTKRVKSNERPNSHGKSYVGPGGHATYGAYADAAYTVRRADPDGTETVAAWECVETCPARLLDEQSGNLPGPGGPAKRGSKTAWPGGSIQGTIYPKQQGGASRFFYTAKASKAERGAYNTHPTVKPLALMRWLVRLVTPAGGVVLDPFLGSGTTALACQREGVECIGIERDEHSVEIAARRLMQPSMPFGATA